jgi:glycerol kinase
LSTNKDHIIISLQQTTSSSKAIVNQLQINLVNATTTKMGDQSAYMPAPGYAPPTRGNAMPTVSLQSIFLLLITKF